MPQQCIYKDFMIAFEILKIQQNPKFWGLDWMQALSGGCLDSALYLAINHLRE